jgi:hypothetical protein
MQQGTLTAAFKLLALSILERAASAWRGAFFKLLIAPLNDLSRTFTAKEAWAMVHHLYRSEAHLARAIYKTALRLSGQPRRQIPLEPFFLPKLKSPDHVRHRMTRHIHMLANTRRYAIRLAQRWQREQQQQQRDPLAAFRRAPRRRRIRFGAISSSSSSSSGSSSSSSREGLRVRAPPWPQLHSGKNPPRSPAAEVAPVCAGRSA